MTNGAHPGQALHRPTHKDDSRHTVKLAGQESGDLASGATYSRTFGQPGEFSYRCGIHAFMTGKVTVKAP